MWWEWPFVFKRDTETTERDIFHKSNDLSTICSFNSYNIHHDKCCHTSPQAVSFETLKTIRANDFGKLNSSSYTFHGNKWKHLVQHGTRLTLQQGYGLNASYATSATAPMVEERHHPVKLSGRVLMCGHTMDVQRTSKQRYWTWIAQWGTRWHVSIFSIH